MNIMGRRRHGYCPAFALGLVIWLLPPAAEADLHFVGDFESGDASGWGEELCCSHSMEVVTSPVRAGNHAARFEIRQGDPTEAGGHRAELRLDNAQTGGEYWYGFSVYLPADWNYTGGDDPYDWLILAQWHGQPDSGEDWRSPPLDLRINQDTWLVKCRHDAAKITTSNPESTILWEADGTQDAGRWTDWVFHVKWSYAADGFVQVWKNGVQVLDHSGPCAFNDDEGPYFKMGMYLSPDQDRSRTVFHDEVRVGGAGSSLQEVSPPGAVDPPPADTGGAPREAGGAAPSDGGAAVDRARAREGGVVGDAGARPAARPGNAALEAGCGCGVSAGSSSLALVLVMMLGLAGLRRHRRR